MLCSSDGTVAVVQFTSAEIGDVDVPLTLQQPAVNGTGAPGMSAAAASASAVTGATVSALPAAPDAAAPPTLQQHQTVTIRRDGRKRVMPVQLSAYVRAPARTRCVPG